MFNLLNLIYQKYPIYKYRIFRYFIICAIGIGNDSIRKGRVIQFFNKFYKFLRKMSMKIYYYSNYKIQIECNISYFLFFFLLNQMYF